jgi:hypothetical protein
MGQFTNDIVRKQRKHKQRVNVPVVIDVADLDDLEEVVISGAASFTGNVTDISESSGNATVTISYEARGANKTDVTKRLDASGVKYITKRPTTDRLCACESGPCTED